MRIILITMLHVVQFVVCTFIMSMSQASMYWEISNEPIIYGHDIILTCQTGKRNDPLCPVRQWFSGPQYKQLLYNSFPSDKLKYQDRTDLSTTYFSLVIKNCTEADLNINYTCSCGFESFTKNLSINEDNLLVQPERKDVMIQENIGNLSIKINLQRVYPQPKCHVVIGNRRRRDVFNSVEEIRSVRNGLFYDCTLEKDFVFKEEDCKQNPKIVCEIGQGHTIINEGLREIQNCTGVAKQGEGESKMAPIKAKQRDTIYFNGTVEAVLAVVFVVGCVVVICIILRKRQKKINAVRAAKAKHQYVNARESETRLMVEI